MAESVGLVCLIFFSMNDSSVTLGAFENQTFKFEIGTNLSSRRGISRKSRLNP